MTVGAANVIAPVFTAAEVVAFLPPGVASETCFRYFLGRSVLKGDDLLRIAFFQVGLARSMASFTAGYLIFPTIYLSQARMRGVQKRLELILVTIFTGFAAYVVLAVGAREIPRCQLERLRGGSRSEP